MLLWLSMPYGMSMPSLEGWQTLFRVVSVLLIMAVECLDNDDCATLPGIHIGQWHWCHGLNGAVDDEVHHLDDRMSFKLANSVYNLVFLVATAALSTQCDSCNCSIGHGMQLSYRV
jgi:hypothetical protein